MAGGAVVAVAVEAFLAVALVLDFRVAEGAEEAEEDDTGMGN